MNIRIALACALLATTFASPSKAADWGFYAGGGIGQATLEDNAPAIGDISEEDAAWKAFAGTCFSWSRSPFVQASSTVPWKYQSLPLSATISP